LEVPLVDSLLTGLVELNLGAKKEKRGYAGDISFAHNLYYTFGFVLSSGDTNHETLHSQLDGASNPA
jgi:hypothetical protein